MIKLTLGEAVNASAALSQLPKINAKASYDLARIRNKLQSLLKPLGDQQREMVEEHGGKIGDDGKIAWPAPKPDETRADTAYLKAWNELLEKEEEIDREPVKLSAILGSDPAKQPDIEPELLSILEKIIVE